MSRLDEKRGRFNDDYETNAIFEGSEGWQEENGDWCNYFRFDAAHSESDLVYDEPTGDGLKWLPPVRIEAMHVTDVRGSVEETDRGFYTNRSIVVKIMYPKFIEAGMSRADINTENYDKDRLVYDNRVFRVRQISIEGQIQERDTVVNITGAQMKPDELVMDAQFANWAPGGPYTDVGGTQGPIRFPLTAP